MRLKSCPVRIKAAGENEGTEDGVFEAIVAAYNTDSVGDRIVPGAFAETLAEWKGRGDPIPVLWSHMSADPDYHIGEVLQAEERPEGLWVKARLDLDEGSKAAKVYRLLKGRRVTQFSFAYDITEGSWVDQKDGEPYYELRRLKLYEVGPTLIGANQATELLDVKGERHARGAKAGRVLSAKNETTLKSARDALRKAADDIEEVLSAVANSDETDDTSDDEKAKPTPPAAPEEPHGAKESRGARSEPASPRLRADLALLAAEVSMLTE
ncbi:HK97 family phage prohead protease [Streptomyces sp. MP131-18]|uniref:HK97 family phage prohead protease n=1 Tax=Streptomyces sp. MP131-18 TaxID=1857892 RepID=UPI00097BF654|nr:HK97 family phage prohead protease [Streptomyces sp. MP131-18]ONK09443.1 phage prohead protease, HK97 family [Streptomyces sp. MP131-18]